MEPRPGRRAVARSQMTTSLELTRSQILAFRRRATALDERLPRGRPALRRAAWAGLQDSMPRAALRGRARAACTGNRRAVWRGGGRPAYHPRRGGARCGTEGHEPTALRCAD